jgi:O-antigen ligase
VNSALFRTLLIYGIVLPLAIVIGWMMSSPDELESLATIGAVLFVLLLPIIFRFHYALLLFSWNATIIVFFLPGAPSFAALMVVVNLILAVGYRVLHRRPMFIHVPMVTFSLVAMAAVVLVTAQFRGGIGMRALGSGLYGGRQYFNLLIAILGYFAFASQTIDLGKIHRATKLFYLSGMTGIISNLIYLNKGLWILYLIFPAAIAFSQAQADFMGLQMSRIGGFGITGTALAFYFLARHGLRGTFTLAKPWRALIFASLVFLAALSGFRSVLVSLLLLPAILFVLEGLIFTRWLFIGIAAGGLFLAAIIPISDRLPLSMQRSLSILPIDVNPMAEADALGTIEWRLLMWKAVLPDLPKYLWLGKGYGIDPTALYLAQEASLRGYAPTYAATIISGDYHNGPLSVYVPFGTPGVIAFLMFWGVGLRTLWLNWRNGPAQAKILNQFLLGFFIMKIIMFVTVFGSLHSELSYFTGVLGLSVALNRGVCRRPAKTHVPAAASAAPPLGFEPRTA